MPIRWPRLVVGVFLHLMVLGCWTVAQEPPVRAPSPAAKPAAEESPKPGAVRVEEEEPPVYYLKDKQGNLQPVPGFTYEDFRALYDLKKQLTYQPPELPYSIQRLSVTGTATADHAQLTVQFRVLVRKENWVRVPLRLDRALLREPAEYKGPGEQFLHFEADGEGYVSWIRGPAGKEHDLALKVLVPLATAGDETRMKLLAARATSSEMKLKVPLASAVGRVSEGATLALTAPAGSSATEFTVLGFGGEFELAWRKGGSRGAETPTVLEASAAILARIDSRAVDSEATLSVRSHGAAFDHFSVRLPPEARLVPGVYSGYTVTEVEAAEPATPRQSLVEVRLAKKTSGPMEIRLNTHRPHAKGKPDQWCELAGFELVGAARQSGTIAVAAPSDWQVLWGTSDGVRHVEQAPPALRRDDLVAAFDYYTQPCSLGARLVPKRTRTSVEPEYVLLIEADEVRLEAKLKYTIRGAKVAVLDVLLPEWELDEVGPDTAVAVDGVTFGDTHALSIPLLQPSVGPVEVRFRAHRPIPPGTKSLSIPLPQPRVNSLAPAVVAVLPDDNVELTPRTDAKTGLVPEPLPPPLTLPPRQQEPLFYRGEAAKAVFVADLRVHSQSISVELSGRIELQEADCQVEQRLAYRVAYEPADQLTIAVPRALLKEKSWTLLFEEKPLTPVALPEAEDHQDPAQPVPMRVLLPKAQIGACELVVRYALAMPRLAPGDRAELTVPLVAPVDAEVAANRLSVRAPPGIQVDVPAGLWSLAEGTPASPPPQPEVQLTAVQPADHVRLTFSVEQAEEAEATTVDQAWVQTWLTHSVRQDRAVFRFVSSRRQLPLLIPAGVAEEHVSARLDGGKWLRVQRGKDNRWLLPLRQEGSPREHLLELHYHFPEQQPARGGLGIELPRLGEGVWTARLYWQLILPPNEHVISGPPGFTSEFTWAWQGWFWGRRPLRDGADLQTWIGCPERNQDSEAANVYLFSTFGSVERCQVQTASRAWIVLVASGVALILGLLLIYVPLARHPATLLDGAVVLLAAGLWYPDSALLLVQAASLGLVLALLAGVLAWAMSRRRAAGFPELAAVVGETGSAASGSAGAVPAPASTQTAPAMVSAPKAESR